MEENKDNTNIENNDSLFSSDDNGNGEKEEIIDVEEIASSKEEFDINQKSDSENSFDEILNGKLDNFSASVDEETSIQEATAEEAPSNFDFDDTQESDVDDGLITVRPVKFQQFDEVVSNLAIKKNLDIMQDIPMHITVELGRTKSSIKEIINMDIGSIVELDKIAGEQVEIFVNEKLVARGEVIVIEDRFGVRVVNTNIPKEIV